MGIKIERSRREINGAGGLALVGGALGGLSGMVFGKTKQGWISHQSILKSVLGLCCQGRADYADTEMFRDDLKPGGRDASSARRKNDGEWQGMAENQPQ